MRLSRLLALLAAAYVTACSGPPTEPSGPLRFVFPSPIADMRVEPEVLNVAAGDTGILTAQATTGPGDLTGTYYINRPGAGGYYVDSLDIPGVTLIGVGTLFEGKTAVRFDTVVYVAGDSVVQSASRLTDTIRFVVMAGAAPDSADLALHGQYVPVVPGYTTLDFSAAFHFVILP